MSSPQLAPPSPAGLGVSSPPVSPKKKQQTPRKALAKKKAEPALALTQKTPSPKQGPAKKRPEPAVQLGKKAMAGLARPVDDVGALADRWRSTFLGALHAETNPDAVFNFLSEGKKGRYWVHLADAAGNKFTTFRAFCEALAPYGLGTSEREVTRFLYEHLSPSAARRLTLRTQRRGARTDLQAGDGKVRAATRTEQRDWAIDRAPEIVRWFRDQRLLEADVASRCGPERPGSKKKKAIENVEQYLTGIVFEMGENQNDALDHFDEAGRATLSSLDPTTRGWIMADLSPTVSRMLNPTAENAGEAIVYSGYHGNNSKLFCDLLRLHVPRGATIADVTYRTGAFWGEVPEGAYDVRKSDLMLGGDHDDAEIKRADFRALPYEPSSIDALVLDPPYGLERRNTGFDDYGVDATAQLEGPRRYKDLIDDYELGAKEALRVLKPTGRFIVKCQDTASQGGLKLVHVDLLAGIGALGFSFLDMFVLVTYSALPPGFGKQKIARRRHSYFLVFVKPRPTGRS